MKEYNKMTEKTPTLEEHVDSLPEETTLEDLKADIEAAVEASTPDEEAPAEEAEEVKEVNGTDLSEPRKLASKRDGTTGFVVVYFEDTEELYGQYTGEREAEAAIKDYYDKN